MVSQYQRNPVRIHFSRLVKASFVVLALLCVPFVAASYAQSGPIPSEIKDLKMGVSKEAVIEKIKSKGTYTTGEVKKEKGRTKIVWVRKDIPSYKDIEFLFTTKNRLYLIRFKLNDSARADYHAMKRTVFKDYDFSWERPQKLRLPDREMLLYGPEKGMKLYFIEFTDKKTHQKSFELFDRSVSSTDRPESIEAAIRKAHEKGSKDKKPAEPGAKPQEGEKAGSIQKPGSAAPPPKSPKEEKKESVQQPTSAVESPKASAKEKKESLQQPASATEGKKPATDHQSELPRAPQADQKPVGK